ncbi:MAG: PEP-utilizing enzyme, partial [Actinobacteria bacterium]|nr:PEP-utilizing enzyme [Actinomycetota bacterium]
HLGTFREDEFLWTQPETYGNWGGYFFNQVSVGRVFGYRMPGATPDAIDVSFFGQNPTVPPYVHDPRDDNEECSAALAASMGAILGGAHAALLDEYLAQAKAWRATRPDLANVSDEELVAYGRTSAKWQNPAWDAYAQIVIGAAVGPGIVQGVADAVGKSELGIRVFAALGDVASAGMAEQVWALSRLVRDSADLTAEFDAGVDDIAERLAASPAAADFNAGFAALLEDFGHRGVDEWEISAETWFINPTLALQMIERVRRQDDSQSPSLRLVGPIAQREAAVAELTAAVAGDEATAGMLAAGIAAGQASFRQREGGKNASVMLIQEPKLAFRELGRRMVERGVIESQLDIFQLLDSELDEFLVSPAGWKQALAQRSRDWAELCELDPPYVVMHGEAIPPISTWPRRERRIAGDAVAAGTELKGVAGSPGTITARTRVIADMSQADDLQPGEILVCTTTDPSWVPLFMIASAVICEIGAPGSHSVIVSRELGVPCVVSLSGAGHKLPSGTLVELDGSTGVVKVVETA